MIKLDNYYSPAELKQRLSEWVDWYNNHRYHEALDNLKPVDVYEGRAEKILLERKRIKERTVRKRRKMNLNVVYST